MPTVDHDVPFSILATIRAQVGKLPEGEARIAQVILDQPYSAITWSARELAAEAKSSSPTVVRACRRLGFSGLPELRLALAREIGWGRLAPSTAVEGSESSLASVFGGTLETVAAMGSAIDATAFAAATDAVAGARRLLFVCAGPTQVVCRDAQFDLVSIGRPAEFVDDPLLQRLLASRLQADDVCIAVGVSGENELTIRAAQAAVTSGATLITVSSAPRSTLAKLSSIGLTLSSADSSAESRSTASLVAMILLFRALSSALARLQGTQIPPLSGVLDTPLVRENQARRAH